jgi:hypothetical protein
LLRCSGTSYLFAVPLSTLLCRAYRLMSLVPGMVTACGGTGASDTKANKRGVVPDNGLLSVSDRGTARNSLAQQSCCWPSPRGVCACECLNANATLGLHVARGSH